MGKENDRELELQERRKRPKHKGATRKVVSKFRGNIYFIDLIDFSDKTDQFIQDCLETFGKSKLKKQKNRGFKYVLVCVDGYSRYTMVRSLKSKKGETVANAMKSIIEEHGTPNFICCDKGKEFMNSYFDRDILDAYDIKRYHGSSEQKSVYAEVNIRWIKENLRDSFIESKGNWIDHIEEAVDTLNHHTNSTTGYSPHDVFKNNVIITEELEPKGMGEKDMIPQFEVGDAVRITRVPSILEKKSLTYKWSEEVYQVTEIHKEVLPIMYSLSSKDRKYYHWQLLKSKCKPSTSTKVKSLEVVENHHNTRKKKKDYSIYR